MDLSFSNVCFGIASIAAVVLVAVGFWQIFKQNEAGENDVQVIQRMIKGFAFLLLAQVVFSIGAAACPLLSGMNVRGRNLAAAAVRSSDY